MATPVKNISSPLLFILCLLLIGCAPQRHQHLPIKNTNRVERLPGRFACDIDKRARQYLPIIQWAARQYNLDASLILAIIYTESTFNPYAVGNGNSLGLMQIIPNTAGREVFSRIKNRRGKPTRRYLFDPKKNIDIGTAYLHLLHTVYLAKVTHPLTRHYAVISAYNGGIGTVLRTFSADRRQAISIINQLTPAQVYEALLTRNPSAPARKYLHKVNNAHQHYRQKLLRFSGHYSLPTIPRCNA